MVVRAGRGPGAGGDAADPHPARPGRRQSAGGDRLGGVVRLPAHPGAGRLAGGGRGRLVREQRAQSRQLSEVLAVNWFAGSDGPVASRAAVNPTVAAR